MTPTERELLSLILTETRRVESLPTTRGLGDDPSEWVRRKIALDDLKELGVRVDGSWIGTSGADRQQRRRGLQRLADAGLVVLSAAWGRATTHVALTPEGRKLAEGLATEPEGDR